MIRSVNGSLRVSVLGALLASLFLAAPPGDTRVADAAQQGDVETVRTLLRGGADVNASQADGMTALHWAAQSGNAKLIEVLAYAGADLEATTRLGAYTPLHLAARNGNAAAVEALLKAGADVSIPTATGATALHLAAGAGNAEAITALLDHGADVNAREDAANQTPLIFAVAENRSEAVKVLLAHGADVSLTTKVVDYAERAQEDVVDQTRREKLMEAMKEASGQAVAKSEPPATDDDVPWKPGQGEPPAGAKAEKKAPKAQEPADETPPDQDIPWKPGQDQAPAAKADGAKKGDEAKGPPEPKPLSYADLVGRQGGMTALHYAARDGHLNEAKELLAAGADVNEVTAGDHSSPLLIATINGNYDLAMYLLDHGADPKLESDAGATPLFTVLNNRWAPKAFYPQPTAFKQQETSYLDLMTALLDHGADPNVRLKKHLWYTSYNFDLLGVDFMGATPFWRAAYALDIPAMKLLVARGADPTIPTMKPPERRRGASRGGGGFGIGRPGEEQEKKDPSGLPPVEIYGPGVYPIHAASGEGYGWARAGNSHRHVPDGWLPAVKYLVEELHADVNARDFNGFTPLHDAAARGDNELIQYLVDHGADPTLVARSGQTTVDMANGPQQRVQPFPETIALLEGMGAKNNHKCQSCE